MKNDIDKESRDKITKLLKEEIYRTCTNCDGKGGDCCNWRGYGTVIVFDNIIDHVINNIKTLVI